MLLIRLGVVVLLCSLAQGRDISAKAHVRAPVILVPGLGGSVLESKLHNVEQPHLVCSGDHDWQVEWVVPGADVALIDCLLNVLTLQYDPATETYRNNTGVEIRPYAFGGLGGVSSLDPQLPEASGTFLDMIKALKAQAYREKVDLFGAPYDFRLAADGLEQIGWYTRFRNLIEDAVAKNHDEPAVLVTHSMGGLVTYYFLRQMAYDSEAVLEDWTRRHIAGVIALAVPWGGAVTAMKGQISGDPFDLPVPHALLRPVQKTSPSGPWLFPRSDAYGDDVLVKTAGGDEYRVSDGQRLLEDLNLTQQAAVYPRIKDLIQPIKPLDVPVHCIYGTDVNTEVGYGYDVEHFGAKVPPAPKKIVQGPGDGTVNLRSLKACEKLGPQVQQHAVGNATHLGVLSDDRAVSLVLELVRSLQSGHSSVARPRPAASAAAPTWSLFGRLQQALGAVS